VNTNEGHVTEILFYVAVRQRLGLTRGASRTARRRVQSAV